MNRGRHAQRAIRARVLAISLILGMSLFAVATGSALAHANLVRSQPAANAVLDRSPTKLQLWFSEAPERRFSSVQLLDRNRRPVSAVGPLQAVPSDPTLLVASIKPLAPGIYTVVWRASSAVDGHITNGAFAFAIGRDQVPAGGVRPAAPSSSASSDGGNALSVGARWLGYLGTMLLAGVFAFILFVLQPALEKAEYEETAGGRRRSHPVDVASSALNPPLLVSGAIGWGLTVVATLGGAVLQAATGANVEPLSAFGGPLQTLLTDTRYGTLFWFRVLLLALLGGLLGVGIWRLRRSWFLKRRWWRMGLVLCALLLLATTLGSHAAGDSAPIPESMIDWLHLAAVSVWGGGLIALLVALTRLRRADIDLPARAVGRLVARFSSVALLCVTLLGLTGFLRAIAEVGDLDNLTDTAYGTALLVKVGLFGLLMGLAAVNLLLVKRRLLAADTKGSAAATMMWSNRLRWMVAGEIVLLLAVIGVTGVLTSLPTGREAFGPGLVVRGEAVGVRAMLVINPGQAGMDSFDVYLRDADGHPITDAEKVALIFTMAEMNMGQNEAVASNAGDGHYLCQGGYMPMVGTWYAQLLVRRPGLEDVRIDMTLRASPPPSEVDLYSAPAPGAFPSIGLILIGLFVAIIGWQMGNAWPRAGIAALAVGITIVALGAAAMTGVVSAPSHASLNSPVLALHRSTYWFS